jgi:hypothetical protein
MTHHTTRNKRKHKKRGGAATAFPSCYFDPTATPPAASSGGDLLVAADRGIRPAFQVPKGGRRTHSKRRTSITRHKKKGGFYPSVMGNFTASASKYIVPMSLYAAYKMMRVSKTGKGTRRTRKR